MEGFWILYARCRGTVRTHQAPAAMPAEMARQQASRTASRSLPPLQRPEPSLAPAPHKQQHRAAGNGNKLVGIQHRPHVAARASKQDGGAGCSAEQQNCPADLLPQAAAAHQPGYPWHADDKKDCSKENMEQNHALVEDSGRRKRKQIQCAPCKARTPASGIVSLTLIPNSQKDWYGRADQRPPIDLASDPHANHSRSVRRLTSNFRWRFPGRFLAKFHLAGTCSVFIRIETFP